MEKSVSHFMEGFRSRWGCYRRQQREEGCKMSPRWELEGWARNVSGGCREWWGGPSTWILNRWLIREQQVRTVGCRLY